jgi:hypothetical protein
MRSQPNPFTWRTIRALGCAALGLVAVQAHAASAAAQLSYQLKAGYLFNFAKFIEWPPPPLPAGDVFRVGVVGDADAFEIIASTLHGKSVGPNPIEVVLLRPDQDARDCRVVFIPKTAGLSPAEYRARQPNSRLLLVGEKDGFAAEGGDIGFVPRGDNLRYQVNLDAAKITGLRLSARLASLAEIVQPAR